MGYQPSLTICFFFTMSRNIPIGDQTLSALEIWGAEYQENDCFLCTEEDLPMVLQFAKRENCPMGAVGKVISLTESQPGPTHLKKESF